MSKEIIKSMSVLAIICIVCTILLSVVYVITEPYVSNQMEMKANEKYAEIFPLATNFEKINESIMAYQETKEIGFVKEVDTVGYGGNIKLLVGINKDNMIEGVRVLEQAETPGLGAKIVLLDFLNQFIGKDKNLEIGKDIDSITGATISSTAVIEGVKKAYGIESEEKYNNRDGLETHVSDHITKDDIEAETHAIPKDENYKEDVDSNIDAWTETSVKVEEEYDESTETTVLGDSEGNIFMTFEDDDDDYDDIDAKTHETPK